MVGDPEHERSRDQRESPAKQFRLNEQTTWAVGYYTAYGQWTSVMSALATWAVLAGLSEGN